MKKTSWPIAALFASLLSIFIVPSTYADDSNRDYGPNYGVPPIVNGQYGVTTCGNCDSDSCLCNTPNNNIDTPTPDGQSNEGIPPRTKDGQLGATVCENCNTQSCVCGKIDNNTDTTPVPAIEPLPALDNNNASDSTSSDDGDSMDSSSNDTSDDTSDSN
jgi:hypothetical protein